MKRSNAILAALASVALGAAAPALAQDEHSHDRAAAAQPAQQDTLRCPMMSHDDKGSGMAHGMMGQGMGSQQMMQMMQQMHSEMQQMHKEMMQMHQQMRDRQAK